MDYKRIYEELIEHRKMLPKLEGVYYERHHIVPRCMGGGDEEENLIYLTAEDHFMAHLLLAKAYGGRDLWFAVTAMEMTIGGIRNISRRRAFALARREVAISCTKRNERRKWVRLSDGAVFELTRWELYEQFGVPLGRSRYVVSSDYKHKVANGFALYGVDVTSDWVDKVVYHLVRLEDGKEFRVTRKQMLEELRLTRGHVNGLVYGNTKASGGYYRKDLRFKESAKALPKACRIDVSTKFINKHGEIFVSSIRKLKKDLCLTKKQVERLLKGLPTTADKIRALEYTSSVCGETSP